MNLDKSIENIENEWNKLLPLIKSDAIENLKKNLLTIDFKNRKIIGLSDNLKFGVYAFTITPNHSKDILNFDKEWLVDEPINKTPIINFSRFNKKDINNKSFKLYIGKSEKLSSRIRQHCFQERNKTTYGLKLLNRNNLLKKVKIKVGYYELNVKNTNKHIIQFIITNLERELREEFNPWIGKQ